MSEPADYAGPELRQRVFPLLGPTQDAGPSPIWVLWRREHAAGATPVVARSPLWDDAPPGRAFEAVRDCYGISAPRVRRLRDDQAAVAARHWTASSDARPCSSASGEAEVLFRDGTRFEVLENSVGSDGIRNLLVRELP